MINKGGCKTGRLGESPKGGCKIGKKTVRRKVVIKKKKVDSSPADSSKAKTMTAPVVKKKRTITIKKRTPDKPAPKRKITIVKKKAAAPKLASGTQAIEIVNDSEQRWNMKRLFKKDIPRKEVLYLRGGKIYEQATGGRSVAKLSNNQIVFPGKFGMVLTKSPKGFYYNKMEYRKDWWKGNFPNKGQIPTTGYEYNII